MVATLSSGGLTLLLQETLPNVQELKQEFIYGKLRKESPLVTAKVPLVLNLPS